MTEDFGNTEHLYYKEAADDLARIKPIALAWLEKNTDRKNWSEDDWHTLEQNWDINIWLYPDDAKPDDSTAQKATLYYVVDNGTIPDFFFSIE